MTDESFTDKSTMVNHRPKIRRFILQLCFFAFVAALIQNRAFAQDQGTPACHIMFGKIKTSFSGTRNSTITPTVYSPEKNYAASGSIIKSTLNKQVILNDPKSIFIAFLDEHLVLLGPQNNMSTDGTINPFEVVENTARYTLYNLKEKKVQRTFELANIVQGIFSYSQIGDRANNHAQVYVRHKLVPVNNSNSLLYIEKVGEVKKVKAFNSATGDPVYEIPLNEHQSVVLGDSFFSIVHNTENTVSIYSTQTGQELKTIPRLKEGIVHHIESQTRGVFALMEWTPSWTRVPPLEAGPNAPPPTVTPPDPNKPTSWITIFNPHDNTLVKKSNIDFGIQSTRGLSTSPKLNYVLLNEEKKLHIKDINGDVPWFAKEEPIQVTFTHDERFVLAKSKEGPYNIFDLQSKKVTPLPLKDTAEWAQISDYDKKSGRLFISTQTSSSPQNLANDEAFLFYIFDPATGQIRAIKGVTPGFSKDFGISTVYLPENNSAISSSFYSNKTTEIPLSVAPKQGEWTGIENFKLFLAKKQYSSTATHLDSFRRFVNEAAPTDLVGTDIHVFLLRLYKESPSTFYTVYWELKNKLPTDLFSRELALSQLFPPEELKELKQTYFKEFVRRIRDMKTASSPFFPSNPKANLFEDFHVFYPLFHSIDKKKKKNLVNRISGLYLNQAMAVPEFQQVFNQKIFRFIKHNVKLALGVEGKTSPLTDLAVTRPGGLFPSGNKEKGLFSGVLFSTSPIKTATGEVSTKNSFGFYHLNIPKFFTAPTQKEEHVLEWQTFGQSFKSKVTAAPSDIDFSKYYPAEVSPKYADLWDDDKRLGGMVVIGDNMSEQEELLGEYQSYYKSQGFKFSAPVKLTKVRDFLKEKVESGELDYLVKEAHSGGNEHVLVSINPKGEMRIANKKHADGTSESVYLYLPEPKKPTDPWGVRNNTENAITNKEFAEWMKKRTEVQQKQLLFFNTSCSSVEMVCKEIQDIQSPQFMAYGAATLNDTFVNAEDSALRQFIHGIRKKKTYAEIREMMQKDPSYAKKESNDYLMPDEPRFQELVVKKLENPVDVDVAIFDEKGNRYYLDQDD